MQRWAVAVRRPDGSIHTEAHAIDGGRTHRGPLRGLIALTDSLAIGIRGIQVALRQTAGVELTAQQVRSTLAAAAVGALVLLVVLPGIVAAAWTDPTADALEAALRAGVLLVYLIAVSRSSSAARLFAYHGAEHKVVAALERVGGVPGRDDARAASPIHPRCGTNFVALFVLMAGAVHTLLPRDPLWLGALWRMLAVPIDAMLAYEVMRAAAGEARSIWARVVTWPGRALQHVTTREPTDDQLDVAFAALATLLDG